jgi:hypothetical protein
LAGWAATRLAQIPTVPGEPEDPAWHPLQHYFRLTAFGANAFVAPEAGMALVSEHDESESGQEELYVVLAGAAAFVLDGERLDAPAVTAVAIRDPSVRRSATATEDETVLLAIGAPARDTFESTWRASHFEGVPTTPF